MTTRLDIASLDLMDALDLAVLIEVEAYERYQLFASQLGHRFPGDAAGVFASMAENESKHGMELAKRRQSLFGERPVRVSRDDLFDVEAPDPGSPRFSMSPLQALKVALSSERKAYAFYDQALPHVTDPEIHALFVELRDEEAEHERMLLDAIARLPAEAGIEGEVDQDELPAM